jgi:hypothetical protein
MTDLLLASILTGLAVTYVIEFLDLITTGLFGKTFLNKYLALPLSFGGMFALYQIDMQMIVSVPAATFVSLIVSKYLNKPVVINNGQRLPRL